MNLTWLQGLWLLLDNAKSPRVMGVNIKQLSNTMVTLADTTTLPLPVSCIYLIL